MNDKGQVYIIYNYRPYIQVGDINLAHGFLGIGIYITSINDRQVRIRANHSAEPSK